MGDMTTWINWAPRRFVHDQVLRNLERGSKIFSPLRRPDRLWGPTQPPIEWVPGALSPGVKWTGRETDHSPPTSAEIKKM
jgi:hypothetical protein